AHLQHLKTIAFLDADGEPQHQAAARATEWHRAPVDGARCEVWILIEGVGCTCGLVGVDHVTEPGCVDVVHHGFGPHHVAVCFEEADGVDVCAVFEHRAHC